jgi:hypothetical protein
MTGLEVAQREAAQDPRRRFLASWAQNDVYHGFRMDELKPGEQHVWYNPYPHDEERRSGKAFLQECGLQTERQMGFLYRAYCREDGHVVLESQTVDQSDDEAFAAAMATAENDPTADINVITRAYDRVLERKLGGEFYAGRREAERQENVWEQIKTNRDLVEYLLDGLEALAWRSSSSEQLELATKRHVYGAWALFKKRLDGNARPTDGSRLAVATQAQNAFHEFAREGRVLVGCGGAISVLYGEQSIMEASPEDVFRAIFGNKLEYKFDKKMFCVECQAPPKDHDKKKMCGPCGYCRACDKKLGGEG